MKTSVNDLIKIIGQQSSQDVEVVNSDARPGEVQDIYLKYDHTYEILGWKPEFDITTGIGKTWNWFKSNKT